MSNEHAVHVTERVIALTAERAATAPEQITPATNFVDDLHFDSLDMVELTMGLEEEFEFSVADEDVDKLHTVAAVVDYVARRTNDALAKT